jgi:hypothetical protein
LTAKPYIYSKYKISPLYDEDFFSKAVIYLSGFKMYPWIYFITGLLSMGLIWTTFSIYIRKKTYKIFALINLSFFLFFSCLSLTVAWAHFNKKAIVVNKTSLRVGPLKEATILSEIPLGIQINIRNVFKDSSGTIWVKIDLPQDGSGWILIDDILDVST